MKSKYVDTSAIIQVIGNIFNNPELLDSEKYIFSEEDFPEEFHKIVFGTLYNLYNLGSKDLTIEAVEDYLKQRPKKKSIYDLNKGAEYLATVSKSVQSVETFPYYYQRVKKMTLLRMYNEVAGVDVKHFYDPDNIIDLKKKQKQEEWLDTTPIGKMAEEINQKIEDIKIKYADFAVDSAEKADTGAMELLEELKKNPAVGVPLFGSIVNTITRGARLTKFYLRSGSQGIGKSRVMVADVCYIGCDEYYDSNEKTWIKNGCAEPTSYIATEQQKDEVQTMMIAFLSDVDEGHILDGEYEDDEWERVCYAVKVLERSNIYIQTMPDFSLKDIENAIKLAIKEHGVRYVFFDYIFGSMKILSEVSSNARVANLREDNVLFMISTRLKDICNEYGIFIMSASQLSGEYRSAKVLDQSFLRGAKSLSDKIDVGIIMVQVNDDDIAALQPILDTGIFEKPAIKMSIYKNRRGKYNNILLWCRDRRGVCKVEAMFATTYDYELIDIPDLKIKIREESAF